LANRCCQTLAPSGTPSPYPWLGLTMSTITAASAMSPRQSAMPDRIARYSPVAMRSISKRGNATQGDGLARPATGPRSQPRHSTQSGMPWSRPAWSRANQTHATEEPHKQRSLRMPCGNLLDIHRSRASLPRSPGLRRWRCAGALRRPSGRTPTAIAVSREISNRMQQPPRMRSRSPTFTAF
jgi:hypothetical protein